ncbi:ABC transporter permease [Ammoniphilus resinae]|uniref:Lipoprotein-releasing system permease protein n=1 Tax=Ammoniphilus resinae TaxID=861532 RepID=A0ABS4GVU6_9BACL|nr:ABC transporter permease [Ammoniphilus resinae]MBP1934399.1 lipoprotein-releasing system permease protein [Ammoniphilus resinae]
MIFEWKVAVRFLKEGKGQTLFILLGITVGVGVMVFLNTLITGLQANMIHTAVGDSPHVWISGDDDFYQLKTTEESSHSIRGNFTEKDTSLGNWESIEEILMGREDISAVSPVAEGNGFVNKSGQTSPVLVRGVDLERANKIYRISDRLIDGMGILDGNYVMIGKELAAEYEIAVHDAMTIQLANGTTHSFTVSGIFDLENKALNSSWIFMDLERAQKLLGLRNDISSIEMQIHDVFDAELVMASIANRLDGIHTDNWMESNASLLTGLQSQQQSSLMIQGFVLLAVTLGIASVLAVSVVQKSKQLGILKAMGTKSRSASRIFLFQGGLLGIIGSTLGAGVGIALVKAFLWGTSLKTGVPLFPLQLEAGSIVPICMIAIVACTIAAFLPARKSSKLNPVEVIRHG